MTLIVLRQAALLLLVVVGYLALSRKYRVLAHPPSNSGCVSVLPSSRQPLRSLTPHGGTVRYVAIAFISLWIVAGAAAQDAPMAFDVASVKPAAPDRPVAEMVRRPPPGQWRLLGLTLKNVIVIAYPE